MKTLTSGALARQANVNVETLRYYERRGLLGVPARRASGYRQYTAGDLARVRAIRHAQRLGFTLNEIRDLLSDFEQPQPRCAPLRRRAERKIAELTAKVVELEQARTALQQLIAGCTGTKACRSASNLMAIADI
jgi:MerR family transcriptional regulator, copper efflux regulator